MIKKTTLAVQTNATVAIGKRMYREMQINTRLVNNSPCPTNMRIFEV